MSLLDLMNEGLFEFAQTMQSVFDKGWRIKEMRYGEARLGIGPSLVFQKDDEVTTCYGTEDVERLIQQED